MPRANSFTVALADDAARCRYLGDHHPAGDTHGSRRHPQPTNHSAALARTRRPGRGRAAELARNAGLIPLSRRRFAPTPGATTSRPSSCAGSTGCWSPSSSL